MQSLSTAPTRSSQTVGQAFMLLLIPTGRLAALGPAWAVLCGACAAASWLWQGARTSSTFSIVQVFQAGRDRMVTLVLVLFIAEVLWSSWRTVLVKTDWAGIRSHRAFTLLGTEPTATLPYTAPWSPLGRLRRSWTLTSRQLWHMAPAEITSRMPTLAILAPLILVLSSLASPATVLLSLAAMCLALIEWRMARRGTPSAVLQASVQVGLSWFAGHSVFAQLTISSFTLACCYAISYQGALSLDAEPSPPQPQQRTWSLTLFFGGQAAALALLVLMGHPFVAVLASMLLAPQMLLLSRLGKGEYSTWFLRRALPFLMTAMPLVAWTAQT